MSDHEFDNYLALLSRLLRLGDKQRDAIASELRAHLEDRLGDLIARGVPREQAVKQALEEFGDAAGLAAEIGSIARSKRRRWFMRLTTASAAAVVLIAAAIFTFWPGNNAGPGAAKLVAQPPAATGGSADAGDKPVQLRVVKEALDRRMSFDFSEKPLKDAIKQFTVQTGIKIHIDARHLEEAGVNIDTPVTIAFSDIRCRTFLDLLLGGLELTFLVKDDVLIITTPEYAENPENMIARVYDCRELLELPRPPGSLRPKVVPGGRPARPSSGAAGAEEKEVQPEVSDSENLIDVIQTTVDPESWVDVGGPCSISEYKGLLTISATQDTHHKVEHLLNMLHQAANLKALKVTVIE